MRIGSTVRLGALAACLLLVLAGTADAQAPRADVQTLVKGNARFALELQAKLGESDGLKGRNLFFSPYSISAALAMAYASARARTAEEMKATLRFGLDQARLHPAFKALGDILRPEPGKDGYLLYTANALWHDQRARLAPDFLALTKDSHGAVVKPADFNDPDEAAETVNRWVEQQTVRRVRNLLTRDEVAGATMVLTSAVYFKGKWASQFEQRHTRFSPFMLAERRIVRVPMMHQSRRFPYAEVPGAQVLEMPYVGGSLSMVVVLPGFHLSLAEMEGQLDVGKLAELLGKLRERQVEVVMPRFSLTTHFSAKAALSALGMSEPFEPTADFSGMGDVGWIRDVIHKAQVEVDEEGTIALGSTGVVMTKGKPRPPAHFTADRPFFFLIRDRRSGSILFMGRVTDPSRK